MNGAKLLKQKQFIYMLLCQIDVAVAPLRRALVSHDVILQNYQTTRRNDEDQK